METRSGAARAGPVRATRSRVDRRAVARVAPPGAGGRSAALRQSWVPPSVEVVFEEIEVRRPERPIGREPLVELGERFRSDAIQPALCVHARLDQSGVPEDAQMFGHGRLAHADTVDELADRPLAVTEQIENRQPTRLGENLESSKARHT